jgi:hypothetical protein
MKRMFPPCNLTYAVNPLTINAKFFTEQKLAHDQYLLSLVCLHALSSHFFIISELKAAGFGSTIH